ncbi:separin-like isoform X2 [Portunus trituberculatus]|uniref:separin-like isoform X2 n=1 Tax=Portunus trituberculatus TaxID=210409 RepID=UPI001E1CBB48|nr:separin-like isoform X2 [Portunus trituberculatus]
MTQTVRSLTDEVLAKLGATSLTQITSTLPSALTSGVHLNKAETDDEEEAFYQLSLTHSTLLHHRVAQRLYKPKVQDEESSVELPEEVEEGKKVILSTTSKEETMNLLRKLPAEWTVVQITSLEESEERFQTVGSPATTPGLYLSRCVCGPSPSVVVQTVASPKNMSVSSILQEMISIKSDIKSSFTGGSSGDSQHRMGDKKEALNFRMKSLVKSMEVAWLRHWCCLLVGSLHPKEEKVLEKVTSRILSAHKLTLTDSQKQRFKCIISCPMGELEGEVEERIRAGVAAVLGEGLSSSVVKDVCCSIKKAKDVLTPLRKATRNPLILVLDKSTVALPWEMMWVLRNQPITRMPSVRMLALLYEHHANLADSVLVQGVDVRKGFYLLDPEGNLPRTQERLKGLLEATRWPGITARLPSHQEFSSALVSNDVFLYAGHGSGSQYLPGEMVEKVMCRALVLLFGCSSVRLLPRGRIPDPWGVVMHYFIANCPCVVGMLWEVTDRSIDHLTTEMIMALQNSLKESTSALANAPSDVALLVAHSRDIPKHYVMASALCVYGLPLHLVHSDESAAD